jgi:hypothetical protein
MLGDILPHASRNIIEGCYRLKNGRYRELRNIYPDIPSHYILEMILGIGIDS